MAALTRIRSPNGGHLVSGSLGEQTFRERIRGQQQRQVAGLITTAVP